jgi:uncharacterized peroxidase-related enzyme
MNSSFQRAIIARNKTPDEEIMAFIRIIPVEEATGDVREMYDRNLGSLGYVPNYTSGFCLRPNMMEAWGKLNATISGNMDRRRCELVMLAAAQALKSSYCALAYGQLLRNEFYSAEELEAIARDYHDAGLEAVDVAVMDFAQKVAVDATTVAQQDIDELRGHGLTDQEIFDVITAAAARAFFTKVLTAAGVQPDGTFEEKLEAPLYRALARQAPASEG